METWTPKLVGERLIDAHRWLAKAGKSARPAGIRAGGPVYSPTWEDLLEDGIILLGGDDDASADDDPMPAPTPAMVSAYEAALEWPITYLRDHTGSAKMVLLWAVCQARRRSFKMALSNWLEAISRGHAYQLRDRGLSLISQGLDRDGVPLNPNKKGATNEP